MDWKRLLHVLFFVALPLGAVLYVFYRLIWTLSAMRIAGWRPSQNNIKIATQWGSLGVEFQREQYGTHTWADGKASHPVKDWLYGFGKIYLFPLVLFGWGFWSGMFWGKNDPQVSN